MEQSANNKKPRQAGWWKRHYQRQIRPKGLENTVRRWRSLGTVYQGAGVKPDGNYLVYGMNATTLEIGQGSNGQKGMMGLSALLGFAAMTGLWVLGYFMANMDPKGLVNDIETWALVLMALVYLLSIPMAWAFLRVFLTDFFG